MLVSLVALCVVCSDARSARIVEYEAEDQETSGTIVGPDRRFGTVAAEASGRRAVQLDNPAQSIRLRLAAPARGLTVRYSIRHLQPDERPSSTLTIEANGRPMTSVRLTSHYSPLAIAHPSAPRFLSHHFWEEQRILLPKLIPAGSVIVLRMASKAGPALALDLLDAEGFGPPEAAPRNALSVLQFKADPSGRRSSRSAFVRAIAAASRLHKPLFVPPGRYRINNHLVVDRVAIVGAGSWYTILVGHRLGFYSRPGGSNAVSVSNLAVEGDIWKRQDQLPLAAIGGTFSSSSFTNLYLHRAKVGMWLDGPAHDISISNVEIADQSADGINLHRGIVGAVIERSRIRNVGDDGIASWSDGVSNENILIRQNKVQSPGLANGIAIYGGRNIEVIENRIADVLTEGGGIHLGARFHSVPFSGRIVIADNLIVRAATLDPNWHFGVGAIWLYALERPIHADIIISRNRIEDARCEAVQLIGPYRIDGVELDGLRIVGPVSQVLALQTAGSMKVAGVVTKQVPSLPAVSTPGDFQLSRGAGNQGWDVSAASASIAPGCS